MSFGAILSDDEGNPFYIDGTLPLRLVSRITKEVNGNSFIRVHATDYVERFVFCEISGSGGIGRNSYFRYEKEVNADYWGVRAVYYDKNNPGTINVYVFEYQYETNIPDYGIAIWDEQKRCVITNETKVLRGVNSLGNEGSDSGGYNIDIKLPGRWAILPVPTGIIVGVVIQGSTPMPFSSELYAFSYFDGVSTTVRSGAAGGSPGGGVSNITYINARNTIKAIDVSMY